MHFFVHFLDEILAIHNRNMQHIHISTLTGNALDNFNHLFANI